MTGGVPSAGSGRRVTSARPKPTGRHLAASGRVQCGSRQAITSATCQPLHVQTVQTVQTPGHGHMSLLEQKKVQWTHERADGRGLSGLWRSTDSGKLRQRHVRPGQPALPLHLASASSSTAAAAASAGPVKSVRFGREQGQLRPPPAQVLRMEPSPSPVPIAPPPSRDSAMTWRRQQHARQVAQLTRESELRRRAQTADRMKWGDRGVGITRLWDPTAASAHLPDVCAGKQFDAPRWVERASEGSTVEVDDRSPSAGAGSNPTSPGRIGNPLFQLPVPRRLQARRVAPSHSGSAVPAVPAKTPPAAQLNDTDRRRQIALQNLRDNQKQTAEKERRQKEERERVAREEAALDEHIRRESERERGGNRVLTPTKYRWERGATGVGCEFGTQTEPGRQEAPAELVERRHVNVGTDGPPERRRTSRQRTKTRGRPVKLEERPRWNAPQPEKVYLKQSEKDLLVARGPRRRRESQLHRDAESGSDSDTLQDWPTGSRNGRRRHRHSDISRSSLTLSDRQRSRAPPRYRSHSPLKSRVSAYYAASSDGKLSSSSSSRQPGRSLGASVPLVTASDVLYLPEFGNVALVPLSQPHLAYLRHAQSLPLLAAAAAGVDIPVYPPVSTEKALMDIGSRVVSASSRDAADSRNTDRAEAPAGSSSVDGAPRRSRRDNGTDKEDEEPPLLYREPAAGSEQEPAQEETGSEQSSGSGERSEQQETAGTGKDSQALRTSPLADAE
ncbi:uncharacterized protein LOC119089364 [Pollicipes pollicipes]|uniref:uncharacterized protein LOC119089364 n=1 Tax=Pollicipes pollicipes TaxID=41117 RepID=UPI00188583C4|nr:uncharacterized protein LOC119089364 [Pollicipes pollicipes]